MVDWMPDSPDSVVRSTVLATVATAIGYGSTLLQQMVYARVIGVGASADALAAALAWAVVTTGLLGTTMVSVVVPPYIRMRVSDAAGARALYRAASGIAWSAGGFATFGTFVFAEPLASVLLPGASGSGELANLLRVSAPLHLVWVAVIAITALANARGSYVLAGAASIVPSSIIVVVLVLVPSVEGAAVGYVLGMAGQAIALAALGRDWIGDAIPSARIAAVAGLVPRILPIGAAFSLMNATGLVVRSVASNGGPGDVAAIDYATRLSTAAESVLLSGGLAVLLTIWSEEQVTDRRRLAVGCTLVAATALAGAAAIGMIILAPIVVTILFEGGRFRSEDVPRVSGALAGIAAGMAARMVLMVALRSLLARQSSWSLAAVGAISLASVGVMSIAGWDLGGFVGLGFGYSTGWLLAAAATVFMAMRGSSVGDHDNHWRSDSVSTKSQTSILKRPDEAGEHEER